MQKYLFDIVVQSNFWMVYTFSFRQKNSRFDISEVRDLVFIFSE